MTDQSLTIVLFHHVQGLTPGVRALADRLQELGHTVHTPDLMDGRTFDSIEEGFGYVSSLGGSSVLVERGRDAAEQLPGEVVWAGMSMGVMVAQTLLQDRPGGLAGIFLHGFIEPTALDGTWPDEVPVHVYGAEEDEFLTEEGGDLEAARAWQADHPNLEVHLYPGDAHLFTDSSLPVHDAGATEEVLAHVEQVLASLGR